METKVCTKCGETKPVGEGGDFGWCKDKRRPSVGYWRSRCKKCCAAGSNKWNKENREKVREYNRKRYAEKREEILEYQRKRYEKNREKKLEYNRKRYVEKREEILENQRKYDEKNREKKLEYQRKRYAEKREEILENQRKYDEKNPQIRGTRCAVERTPLTTEELFNGLSREEVNAELAFDYRLAKLLSERDGEPYEIDHYPVAICNGGHHRLYNIRIVPRWVNRQGGDHSADAFGMEDNLTDEDIERLDREALEFQP